MVDNFLLIGIVTATITFIGIITTIYWNARLRKDKVIESRQTLLESVERTAREKAKQEQTLAEQLAQQNIDTATEVKQSMKEHIDRLIVTLKSDIELQRTISYNKMDSIDGRVAQVKIDLMEHIEQEKDERLRIQKSIDFFQTMQFGPDAKSVPPYIYGEETTEEHEDKAYKGVFASREDTTEEGENGVLETKEEQDENAETESNSSKINKEDNKET